VNGAQSRCAQPRQVNCTNAQGRCERPERVALNPQPSTLNPQPSTLNPQPSTLNPQPSTLKQAFLLGRFFVASRLQEAWQGSRGPPSCPSGLPSSCSSSAPRLCRASSRRKSATRVRATVKTRASTAPHRASPASTLAQTRLSRFSLPYLACYPESGSADLPLSEGGGLLKDVSV